MPREYFEFNEETQEDDSRLVTLEDGHAWSQAVLDDLENANWHTAREAFENLIHILPQIYETLEYFQYHKLARKLQKAVDQWDKHF